MADFEYCEGDNAGIGAVIEHLICPICQSLSVQPVRVRHADARQDCGRVMCLHCYQNWMAAATTTDGNAVCPTCRPPCGGRRGAAAARGQPCSVREPAVPDRLLGRFVANMRAQCAFCGHRCPTEEMVQHIERCPLRRLASVRRGHRFFDGTVVCLRDPAACGDADACRWVSSVCDLIDSVPHQATGYVKEWLAAVASEGPHYLSTRAFQNVALRHGELVVRLWDELWAERAPMQPCVVETIRVYDLFAGTVSPASVARLLSRLRTVALHTVLGGTASAVSNLQQNLSSGVVSALAPDVWSALTGVMRCPESKPSAGTIGLFLHACEAYPDACTLREWTASDGERFLAQPHLSPSMAARLLVFVTRSEDAAGLFGVMLRHWQTRCRGYRRYPLPDYDSAAMGTFDLHQAIATLVAVEHASEVAAALDAAYVDGIEAGPAVLGHFLCAMSLTVSDPAPLCALACGAAAHVLRKHNALRLALPPVVAAHVPLDGVHPDRVMDWLMQGHRMVALHRHGEYSWMHTCLGYVVLLLRCARADDLPRLAHLCAHHTLNHNWVVRGMMLQYATSDLLWGRVPTTGDLARLQGLLVAFLLVVFDNNAGPHAHHALLWLMAHRPRPPRRMWSLALDAAVASLRDEDAMRPDHLRILLKAAETSPMVRRRLYATALRAWTVEAVEVVTDGASAGLLEEWVQRCAIRAGFPLDALHTVLSVPRLGRYAWMALLRLCACAPDDSRRPPRSLQTDPLVRLVMGGGRLADADEFMRRSVFVDHNPVLHRWCQAAVGRPVTTAQVRVWVLDLLRTFLTHWIRKGDRLSPELEGRMREELVTPGADGALAAAILSMLAHFGTDDGLHDGCAGWIRHHACCWMSRLVAHNGSHDRLRSLLPVLEMRALEPGSAEVANVCVGLCAAAVVEDADGPTWEPSAAVLALTNLVQMCMHTNISESMWMLRQCVRFGRIGLWATLMWETRCLLLASWVNEVAEEDRFGPMETVLREAVRLGQPEVLRAVEAVMRGIHDTTSRLNEPEDDEVTDLSTVAAYLVELGPMLTPAFWPVVADIHPVHLAAVPVDAVLRLLRHARADGQPAAAEGFLDLLYRWFQGFGAGLPCVWKQDIRPHQTDVMHLIHVSRRTGESERFADLLTFLRDLESA